MPRGMESPGFSRGEEVKSEPIGYKIAFKYLGQPVHLSSEWKTGVAEKSFREIVNIRRKVNTTEANPELVPDKD